MIVNLNLSNMKKIFVLICALFVVANVSAQTRKVGDIIMVNGEFGVVFAVTTDGLHGKAVSVPQTGCSWDNAKTWCANLGPAWRLPTRDELRIINRNKTVIDSALEANGYTTLGGLCWSSESYDEFFAWSVDMNDGYTSASLKCDYNSVRAVAAF